MTNEQKYILPIVLTIIFIVSISIPRPTYENSLPPNVINIVKQETINQRYLTASILTFGLLDAGETDRASDGTKIFFRVFQLVIIGLSAIFVRDQDSKK